MERIHNMLEARDKVLRDARDLVSLVRLLVADDPASVEAAIAKVRGIRLAVYEDLNQIQHEYLLLRGLQWLVENGFGQAQWEWNARQTGGANEPDLRGILDGETRVSAEASASEDPKGSIDVWMRKTLEKLSCMQGEKFYFVCSSAMAQRARTKISKGGYSITVVQF
jgi:hypothetical protein